MQYRPLGNTGLMASVLGYGGMRFPLIDHDYNRINVDAAMPLVRHAIDQGLNYIDTAYPYHGGASEPFFAQALKDGYRQKVILATKLPLDLVDTAADFEHFLDLQRQRLETEQIDVYLLHHVNRLRWEKLLRLGILEWLPKIKADGRVRFVGFSFHDDLPVFKEVVDAFDWDICQIQYNFVDVENQAGREGLRYAAQKGLGTIVMEPLLGGRLAALPEPLMEPLERLRPGRTAADWAFQWLFNQPEVSLVLSGMKNLDEVRQNLASAHDAAEGSMSANELSALDEVRRGLRAAHPIDCTQCRYCLPCPSGVEIPSVFGFYNQSALTNNWIYGWIMYQGNFNEINGPLACVACGQCEQVCPQRLPIIEWLKVCHQVLGENLPYEPGRHPQR